MASSSKAASGPRMTLTLSRSITSCALVLAPAGLPPVSATSSSTLRPASVLPFSLRRAAMPCSIWMPPCASGPVLTVSRPILKGAAWAMAGAGNGSRAAAVPAAAPARNVRRLSLRDIGVLPRLLLRLATLWLAAIIGQRIPPCKGRRKGPSGLEEIGHGDPVHLVARVRQQLGYPAILLGLQIDAEEGAELAAVQHDALGHRLARGIVAGERGIDVLA